MARCSKCGTELEPEHNSCPTCNEPEEQRQKSSLPDNDRWTFTQATSELQSEQQVDKAAAAARNHEEPGVTLGESEKPKTYDSTITMGESSQLKDTGAAKHRSIVPTPTATLLSKLIRSNTATEPGSADDPDASTDELYIESDTALRRRRATAPRLVKVDTPPSIPPEGDSENGDSSHPSAKKKDTGVPSPTRQAEDDSIFSSTLSYLKAAPDGPLTISAVILIFTWFVPDVWAEQVLFAYDMIALAQGLELVRVLAGPVVGALLLTMSLIHLPRALTATTGMILGLFFLSALLIVSPVPLLFEGALIPSLVLLSILVAAFLLVSQSSQHWGNIALASVPLFLFAVAAVGIFSGRAQPGNLMLLKIPLQIFAGAHVSSHGAAFLIRHLKKTS